MKNGIIHGGDLDCAARQYNLKRAEIIDFSGNINPFGVSEAAKKAICENIEAVTTYPDANYLSLREAAAKYLGINCAEKIVAGNGGTELISLFIRTQKNKNAVIVSPVYSEYEREIRINGGSCEYYALCEKRGFNADIDSLLSYITDKTGLLIICNPNNPTGSAIEQKDMEIIVKYCEEKNVSVLIDETYCEFAEEERFSFARRAAEHSNTIVIRGVSKFFASPGIRLGYAVCGGDIAGRLNKIKDPWSVNSLAVIAALAFFSDEKYIEKTKSFISRERKRVKKQLDLFDCALPFETVTNFQLVKILKSGVTSKQIFNALIEKGIMLRDAQSFKPLDDSYLRFCFLTEEKNDLLLKELKPFLL